MARIRTIKPEFPQSETVGRLSRDARLLFVQLWTIVDDAGRTRAASRMLASLLYPYDDDAPGLIDGWLDELERERCIRRYEIDGKIYLDIPKWLEHQKIDRPSKSHLPEFVEGSRGLVEGSSTDLGPRTKDLGPGTSTKEGESEGVRSRALAVANGHGLPKPEGSFEEFYRAYPVHKGRGAAERAFRAALKHAPPETLIAKAAEFAASRPDPRYTPHPATWLNGKRWLDEQPKNYAAELSSYLGQGGKIPDGMF